jgi:hypothetical protein
MNPDLPDEFTAGAELLAHTGMRSMQIRYQDELEPIIWMVVAEHERDGKPHYSVCADLNPVMAMMRLCEMLVDGGTCTHCHRVTMFVVPGQGSMLGEALCHYEYDPELKKFRRDCEGDAE